MSRRLVTPHGYIACEDLVEGVPVNPKLPELFDCTAHEDRPAGDRKFWHVPYIQTVKCWDLNDEEFRAQWLAAWPEGTRYDVRCLDGAAWDRSSCWGSFATLAAAVYRAKAVARGEA